MKQPDQRTASTPMPSATPLFRQALGAHQAGRMEEARQGYLEVIKECPQHADALCLLAIVLHKTGKPKDALAYVYLALALRRNAMTLCVAGSVLRALQHYKEAETAYRRALELAPDNADIHHDLALTLCDAGRFPEAEAAYHRSLELKPDFADAHNNLGVLFKKTGRLDAARLSYLRALDSNPNCAEAHNNLGVLHKESGHLNEAEAAYRRAIASQPDYADACWNLGLVLLTQGRYAEAWGYYEARYHPKRTEAVSQKPLLAYPQWQGEAIAGKSLLVWTEQGHGDYVQFARYIPLLKQGGACRVTIACAPPLKPLLATVAGVDAVVTGHEEIPEHDYWVFPLSLPMRFATSLETIPATLPYLSPLPERVAQWRERIGADGIRVGLVWKGNPGHNNDANRSLPHLSMLAPLWAAAATRPDMRFFSLQKGSGEDEAHNAAKDQAITALGQDIVDFADTAAIVAQLDLVICVDTAVAHIAGALGTPCWVLLPHTECDWRWMKNRQDSPWYPRAMRLFRQTQAGRWDKPIRAIADELKRFESLRAIAAPPAHHA